MLSKAVACIPRKKNQKTNPCNCQGQTARSQRRAIEPRNFLVVSPRRWSIAGAEPGISDTWTQRRARSHRGRRNLANDQRVFRELGRPCRLHRWLPAGARLTNSRLIHGSRPEPGGDESGTKRWYRQAKETKCGEMDGKESERPIVVLKRGNGPSGPCGAKGAPRCGGGVGTTPRTSASPACHRETTYSCEGQRSTT